MMGRYLTPSPSAAQSRPVKHQQVFKTSGTFTPSQTLLDAGGVVEVRCVGGGGASGSYRRGGGSSGMDITRRVTVTGPISVTIGAGGHSEKGGGNTTFGALLIALGGKPGQVYHGGSSSGEGSQPGCPVFVVPYGQVLQQQGGAGGGSGGSGTQSQQVHAPPNTGGGGSGGGNNSGNGGSGLCIVTWEE